MEPTFYEWRERGLFGAGRARTGRAGFLDEVLNSLAPCPWGAHVGLRADRRPRAPAGRAPLYTPEERRRRDASPWTMVQAVLAPAQFLAFLVSAALIARFLATGEGYLDATVSVLVKTTLLYAIMITGSIWEREVFGRWLFARPFFWEDVFSLLVLALQTAYVAALLTGFADARGQMLIAVSAYAAYAVNAAQFILKLRAARLEAARGPPLAGLAV